MVSGSTRAIDDTCPEHTVGRGRRRGRAAAYDPSRCAARGRSHATPRARRPCCGRARSRSRRGSCRGASATARTRGRSRRPSTPARTSTRPRTLRTAARTRTRSRSSAWSRPARCSTCARVRARRGLRDRGRGPGGGRAPRGPDRDRIGGAGVTGWERYTRDADRYVGAQRSFPGFGRRRRQAVGRARRGRPGHRHARDRPRRGNAIPGAPPDAARRPVAPRRSGQPRRAARRGALLVVGALRLVEGSDAGARIALV